MDPIANLEEQRRLAAEIIASWDGTPNQAYPIPAAQRLAELVLALDEWRRKGGFDPYGEGKQWMKFSDGMQIDISGDYRIIQKSDGLYVTGHGLLSAVDSREQGEALIESLVDRA
jgi:hypothetical protein